PTRRMLEGSALGAGEHLLVAFARRGRISLHRQAMSDSISGDETLAWIVPVLPEQHPVNRQRRTGVATLEHLRRIDLQTGKIATAISDLVADLRGDSRVVGLPKFHARASYLLPFTAGSSGVQPRSRPIECLETCRLQTIQQRLLVAVIQVPVG